MKVFYSTDNPSAPVEATLEVDADTGRRDHKVLRVA
jgi:hypothetical protein